MLVRDVSRQLLHDYGAYMPPERRLALQQEAVHFQDDAAFKARLIERLHAYDPGLSTEEHEACADTVAGYTEPTGNIYLNNTWRGKYYALMHEAIHRVSAREVYDHMGRSVDEGLTHYFARQSAPGLGREIAPVFDPATHRLVRLEDHTPRFYEDETELVQLLAARVGDEPLRQAKFAGDLQSLREAVDRELGPGSFDELCTQTRRLDEVGNEQETQRICHEVKSRYLYT